MMIFLLMCLGIPLAAAALLLLFRGPAIGSAKWIALGGTVAALLVSLGLLHQFHMLPVPTEPIGANQPRFEYRHPWFSVSANAPEQLHLDLHFGLDGISVALIVLTTVLTFSSVLISWEAIHERESEYYASLLVLETGLIGVFCAFDLVMFYVFFELTLIPLFFLIAIWGGTKRRYAAVKFFLYTLTGGLITLLGLAALVLHVSAAGLTTPCSIPDLTAWLRVHPLPVNTQWLLFLALSAGFLVKVPVFPFHTWLPLAHVEAPTAGSVLLAGVLLKLGTYGFLRLCLPFFPDACVEVGLPVIGLLAVIGIIYGSLCALPQRDIKKLVAYSSVAHLGFCMLGMFALNVEGLNGSVLQMVNHGLSTGALFLLVGMVYERYHTRMLDDLSGLAARLPLIACSFVFISMASIGLPGLNGFTGEVLSLIGMFKIHPLYGVLGTSGIILGAWYLLTMLQHLLFGTLKEPKEAQEHPHQDMKVREIVSLVPLAALCLWIGVYPAPILKMIGPDVDAIAAIYAGRISSPLAPSVAADRHDNAVQSPLDNKTALTADAESQPEIQNSLRSLARDGN